MTPSQPRTTVTTPAAQCLTGTAVGRFVIGQRLGRGGMGEVYRAEDTKLRRTVALKRMTSYLRAEPAYRRRVLKEAENTSRLNDPHIAALYDVLENGDETFLVMEYVEGQTLRQRLRQPLTFNEFLQIAVQCACALAAAHERGVIHGDIKPENIMVTSAGQVKILDFGLAKHLPRSDQSSTLERGTLGGTPAYMAPEVLLEKLPDGRADIFSLGVVFYEALTGKNPFLAAGFVATSQRILRESPLPIGVSNPRVPPILQMIISRMLAKEPGQRLGSARELASELKKLQSSGDATAVVTRPSAQGIRYKLAAAMIVVTIFALGIISPRLYNQLHPPLLTRNGWVLITDFDNGGDEPIPDDALREGLTIALQQSHYMNVYPRSRIYEVLKRMKRSDVTRIDENLGREVCRRENLQMLLVGSVAHMGDSFQIAVRAVEPVGGEILFAEKAQFQTKQHFFEKMDWLSMRVRSQLGESLVGIELHTRPLAKVTTSSLDALQLYSEATDAVAQGKLEKVPALLQAALTLDPQFAMAHLRLGEYYTWLVGKNKASLAEFQRAYELRQAATDRERLWIEADYHDIQEQYEKAAESLRALADLYPNDADAHQQLALAYYNLAQLNSAISELRRALELNPNSAFNYGKLVLCLARNNQHEEAIRVYEGASQRGLQTSHLRWGLGLAYLGQGKVERAQAEFKRLTEGSKADQELGYLYLAVADLYQGRLGAAREKLSAPVLSDVPSGLQLVRRYLLGRIYLMQGDPDRAQQQASQILAAPETELHTADVLSAGVLYALARNKKLAADVLGRLDAIRRQTPTGWNNCSFHNLEGEIALMERDAEKAVESFRAADGQYKNAMSHLGLAHAYMLGQDWTSAAREWGAVLNARGEFLQNGFPPDFVLAYSELGRCYRNLAQLENRPFLDVCSWLLANTQEPEIKNN